jgi:hypothetical protein
LNKIEIKNMSEVEKSLENRLGKKSPFLVPDGYFDSLTCRVKSNMGGKDSAKSKRESLVVPLRRFGMGAVAVCVLVAFILVHNAKTDVSGEGMPAFVGVDAVYDEGYDSEMLEYVMVDNNDVYAYLSGDYYDVDMDY